MGVSTVQAIKMAYSMILVIFSATIVMGLMFNGETKISNDVHPALAVVVFWLGILWMSMVEGGQCSMVGLPPIDRELYKESHPITHQICSLGRKFIIVENAVDFPEEKMIMFSPPHLI
jgi:hypothetical protein